MHNYIYRLSCLFVLGSALALCGCAGKNHSGPNPTSVLLSPRETARRYRLNTSWWTDYNSPALNRTVDLALARNVDLARSAIAVNKALYRARLLSADLLPTFSADGSVSAGRDLSTGKSGMSGFSGPPGMSGTSGASSLHGFSGSSGDTWRQNWQGQGAVSYELDLWRRLRDAADAGEWERRATVEDLADARLALINNVVDGWFNLLYTRQSITVEEKSVERYQKMLELTRSSYALGKAASVEPLQAEQSLLAARNQLASLRAQEAQALQTLRNLLNLRPGENPDMAGGDILAIPSVQVDLNVPIAALAARPDIHAAEARMQGAFKTLESDQAAWYPRLTVGSTLSVSADSAGKFFNVPLLAGLAGLDLPFLNWSTLHWNVKISEADFNDAKLALAQSVTTALNEVDATCSAYVQARLTLAQTLAEHDRAARIAEYYRVRYEQGGAELKDYLQAQTSADASALSALSAKYQAVCLESRIYKAMGGRYEPSGNQ